VELCAGLPEGGTTPSYGEILTARRAINIKLNVIIRPRSGDFLYTPIEVEAMLADIRMARELGADGIVVGCLTADGAVDKPLLRRFVEAAEGLPVTLPIKTPEEITILATGGTIDKFYSVAGTMDIGEPAAKDLLDRVITDIRFDIRPLIGKDSLDMTDEDRAELTEALNAVTNDQVLITHGTDTMPETARYLVEHADLGNKGAALTGASV